MGLICISLLANDVAHPFMGLFAVCVFSLMKCRFELFAHFLTELLVFLPSHSDGASCVLPQPVA